MLLDFPDSSNNLKIALWFWQGGIFVGDAEFHDANSTFGEKNPEFAKPGFCIRMHRYIFARYKAAINDAVIIKFQMVDHTCGHFWTAVGPVLRTRSTECLCLFV